MIKIHKLSGYIQSMYLVEYKDKLLLLDSGCSIDVENVRNYIENNLNKNMSDLKLVVVTHAHPDHSGGASIFKEKYSIEIAAPMEVNNHYSGVEGNLTYFVDLFLASLVAVKKGKRYKNLSFKKKLKIDFYLSDEMKLPYFEDWSVIYARGHTECDITLFHSEKKVAYIADNIISSKTSYYRPYPITNPSDYKNTLSKYLELGIDKYLLAHSGEHKISNEILEKLRDGTPFKPRIHKTTLPSILKHVLKSFLK